MIFERKKHGILAQAFDIHKLTIQVPAWRQIIMLASLKRPLTYMYIDVQSSLC